MVKECRGEGGWNFHHFFFFRLLLSGEKCRCRMKNFSIILVGFFFFFFSSCFDVRNIASFLLVFMQRVSSFDAGDGGKKSSDPFLSGVYSGHDELESWNIFFAQVPSFFCQSEKTCSTKAEIFAQLCKTSPRYLRQSWPENRWPWPNQAARRRWRSDGRRVAASGCQSSSTGRRWPRARRRRSTARSMPWKFTTNATFYEFIKF